MEQKIKVVYLWRDGQIGAFDCKHKRACCNRVDGRPDDTYLETLVGEVSHSTKFITLHYDEKGLEQKEVDYDYFITHCKVFHG